jgi:putative ABC transport system ATP-binding protein
MIIIDNATKTYHLGKTIVTALDSVNITIEKGDFVSVVGPSGSGKTTLLNLIGCLDKPSKGKIVIDGQDITSLNKRKLACLRSHKIGFIFQSFNLIPVLNVYENVELPLLFKGEVKNKSEIMNLIKAVGLIEHVNHRPDELSGGQRQRVAIARALVTDPLIVLADEPTANLDSATAKIIIELMLKMNKEFKTTFVFSTHDEDIISYAQKLYKLKDGKLQNK